MIKRDGNLNVKPKQSKPGNTKMKLAEDIKAKNKDVFKHRSGMTEESVGPVNYRDEKGTLKKVRPLQKR